MFKVNIERIGDVAIIHCEGRVVQSVAAFGLRDAVTQQKAARGFYLTSRTFSPWRAAGWACSYFCSDGRETVAFN
jgi:hypothetical protein